MPRLRRPSRSLPARITILALVATLVTSVTVTAISVGSIQAFLRERIDDKFPAILASVDEKLNLWYDQRLLELGVFSNSEILRENLGRTPDPRDPELGVREMREYLSFVLENFEQYDGIFVLGPGGEPVLSVGRSVKLPAARRAQLGRVSATAVTSLETHAGEVAQIASEQISGPRGEALGTLHASLRISALHGLLTRADLGETGGVYLVDRARKILTSPRTMGGPALYARELATPGQDHVVEQYVDLGGERVVGSSRYFPRFGWTLVVEQSYAEAFAPAVSSLRQVLAIDLVIVLLIVVAAFRIAASVVRPIEALSDAARRISEGDEGVVIPNAQTLDEVGVLTQSFRHMNERLADKAAQLEASRSEVEDANRRLHGKNNELQRVNEVLEQLSITDGLTRLHNHRYFQDFLARELKRIDRTAEPLALILIDIDHFKRWNDRHGHAAGDEVLRRIAQAMQGLVRETDLLARYGGEEFALLAPNTDRVGAVQLAEKIRTTVAESNLAAGAGLDDGPVTVSIGVAISAADTNLFDEADRALYRAKDAGRDCVVVAGESSDE